MATPPNSQSFAYSFADLHILIDNTEYIKISQLEISQNITSGGGVRGTSIYILQPTRGQVEMGTGVFTFSSVDDANSLLKKLDPKPLTRLFNVDFSAESSSDSSKVDSWQLIDARLLDINLSFKSDASALNQAIKFEFVRMKINGKDLA